MMYFGLVCLYLSLLTLAVHVLTPSKFQLMENAMWFSSIRLLFFNVLFSVSAVTFGAVLVFFTPSTVAAIDRMQKRYDQCRSRPLSISRDKSSDPSAATEGRRASMSWHGSAPMIPQIAPVSLFPPKNSWSVVLARPTRRSPILYTQNVAPYVVPARVQTLFVRSIQSYFLLSFSPKQE